MIYNLGEKKLKTNNNDFWVAPNAAVIGSVILKTNASVWFGATLRGDNDPITIGENAKVGSNSVVTKAVETNKSVVGNPARYTVSGEKSNIEFMAYGVSGEDDSRTARVKKLEQDNELLKERLSKLEERLSD